MKKKVIRVMNDYKEFERQLNLYEGKFTQTTMTTVVVDGQIFETYLGVLYIEE